MKRIGDRTVWSFLGLAVTLVLAAPCAAGGVIVVDAGGGLGAQFTDLQPAIDAAADGDVLLVRGGTYAGAPYVIDDKSLTVIGDGAVRLASNTQFGNVPVLQIRRLAAAKRVVLRGLALDAGHAVAFPTGDALRTESNEGAVWVDSCTLTNGVDPLQPAGSGLDSGGCAEIVVTRSLLRGGSHKNASGLLFFPTQPALLAAASSIFVHGSRLHGGAGKLGSDGGACSTCFFGGAGAPGAAIEAGSAWFGSSVLQGGRGGDGLGNEFGNCVDPGVGAAGVELSGGALLRLTGSTCAAGANGLWFGICPPPPSMPPILVNSGTMVVLDGRPGDLAVPSPVRELEAFTIEVAHASDRLALLFASLTSATTFLTQNGGPFHLADPLLLAIASIPPSGVLTVPAHAPRLPAGTQALTLFVQGATCAQGMDCTVTSPATITILDASL